MRWTKYISIKLKLKKYKPFNNKTAEYKAVNTKKCEYGDLKRRLIAKLPRIPCKQFGEYI